MEDAIADYNPNVSREMIARPSRVLRKLAL